MFDIEPAWQVAESVRRKERSAREVTEAALERLAAGNERLNAFVHIAPELALQQADAIDAQIARGEDPGPLAGVPIGVKDLEPAAGMPFTMGSRAYKDVIADTDSVQLARLKAAGAVALGKTNTPEFGYKGFTENRLFGATRNPWNPELTPGGSSGGSAAAVSAGLVPLATASDGGGSIRIPAGFCGCYGIKPTAGRIPIAGPQYSHWATHSTLGPVSRTVRDSARYLDAAAGPHPDDLHSLDAPTGGYEAAAVAAPPPIIRIAWSADLGYAVVDPEVAQVARQAAEAFAKALGAELVEADPGFEDPMPAWFAIGAPGDTLRVEELGERAAQLEPGYLRFAESGRGMTAVQVAQALQTRHAVNRQVNRFLDEYTLLLTPTLAAPPFKAEGPPPMVIAGKEVGPAGFIPFTYPFNLTGHPAASLPAGLTAAGLPVGLQVVAPRFADKLLLTVSAAFEAANPWPWPKGRSTQAGR
ncbi:MAG: amidase family protein [Dehalococcoidia bacterium]|nr:amidase family protein [Dehalococcoidia bacterium]